MSFFYNPTTSEPRILNIIVACLIAGISFSVAMAFIGPVYNVWQQGLAGQAELKRAEQNRQIQILEAQAANEAATSQAEAKIKIEKANAQAEVERARGAAEANEIIGESLKGNEEYLRYLYIQMLRENEGTQTIYVPTEASLPILEAGKR